MALSYQTVPGGVGGQGEGGGFGESHRVRNFVSVDGRNRDVFGVAAIQVYAQTLLIGAVLVQSLHAIFADAIAFDPVVQHHPITHFEVGVGLGADLGDLSGHVAAQNAGQRPLVAAPGPQTDVQTVQGTPAHLQHYLAWRDFRFRPVSVGQDLRAAEFTDIDRFH